MASYCIPKELVAKLKKAVRDGDISIPKLYELETTQERIDAFEKVTGNKTLSEKIVKSFERAMSNKQKDAIRKWVERTFPKNNPQLTEVNKRIDDIQETFNENTADQLVEDIASARFGITVTGEEVAEITKRVTELNALYKEIEGEIPKTVIFEDDKCE